MPTFGLTQEMRGEAPDTPWGLPRGLLMPAKVDTDPVHGDLYWLEIERQIIDSPAMQRLRRVRQLGMTCKVYPGAEHSRFTHSLGTVRAAQDILDRAVEERGDLRDVQTLFDEWRDEDVAGGAAFALRLGEATILMRLSALIHDLTHVPFGHTIEDDLRVLTPHDRNQKRFQRLWASVPEEARVAIEDAQSRVPREGREASLFQELKRVVLDKVKDHEWEGGKAPQKSLYPFVGDIVNNTICADLVDYLKRDHLFTGLPMEVGDRFMDNFFVVRSDSNSPYAENLVVNAVRGGEVRRDTITELVKYLRYRYEITERALYHKTKLAFDAMLGKLLEMWRDQETFTAAQSRYGLSAGTDEEADPDRLAAAVKTKADQDGTSAEAAMGGLRAQAEKRMEDVFLTFGDEGLLEHIIWTLESQSRNRRQDGMLNLATRIRDRNQFRMLGHLGGRDALPIAQKLFELYGPADERRKLEQAAAEWAGLRDRWQIVLWVPPPEMRLKVAQVLVRNNRLIGPLDAMEPAAQAIVNQHRELWSLRVYAPAELRVFDADDPAAVGETGQEVLSFLRWKLGDVPVVETGTGQVIPMPWELAAQRAGDAVGLTHAEVRRVAGGLHAKRTGDSETFRALMETAQAVAKSVVADRPAGAAVSE